MTISPIFHKLHQDGIATGFQSMSEFVVSVIKEPNSHGTLNLLSDPISVNDACLQNKVCNLLRAGPSSLGVLGVPWYTQYLADQLALFQPGGTDYAHLITTGTP